jgi:chromate transporter
MNQIPLLRLFAAFFRLGLTAFGGPAMIPHLRRLVIDRTGWMTEADFKTGLAVCQAIPGATVAQLAAYAGLRLRGLPGALTAFAGFMLPAFLLITGLSALYFRYQDLPRLLLAFDGLKILVVAIVLSASLDFIARYTRQTMDKLLALAAALAFVARIHPVAIILCVAAAGLLVMPRPESMTPRPAVQNGCGVPIRFSLGLVATYALMWMIRPELLHLARLMAGIDLVAFGGGFAALPIMLHEVVIRLGWMSQAVFMDGIALGQVTPGPIVLSAAFVGYTQSGLAGAAAAAMGIFTPSLCILFWTVPVCDRLLGSRAFQKALRASLASLGGLMTAVAAELCVTTTWTWPGAVLGLTAFATLRKGVDVLWIVLAGTGAWLVFTTC